MKNIKYLGDYLSPGEIEKCFEPNLHNFVDKSFCGNGFTTSYISLKPTQPFQSNIIIVPNREVILSKREKYRADKNEDKTRIGFIFGDADADKISFKDFDVQMFVIDSFIDRIEYLKEYSSCIDKMLIDEMHSMYIQSSFRKKLRFIDDVLSDNFRQQAKVSVSATPMLFQKIDIRLFKEVSQYREINITENQNKSLDRLKELIRDNKKVIVATHNAQLIASLSNKKKILKANFKIGVSLKKNLVEKCKIIQDAESNLTIISSSGFEGFDVLNGINSVFIFEDRAHDFSTFYFQNILQIIGRSRKGTNYIEYCRNTHSKGRTHFDLEEMNKVVNSKRISFEKKMTDKNYYYIPKFYYPLLDKQTEGFIKSLVLDDISYSLYSENQNSDVNGSTMYKTYAKERGFNIIELNEGTKRVNFGIAKEKTKFKYIQQNLEYIQKNKIFEDVKINLLPKENLKQYIKEVKTFFRRKYFNNLQDLDIRKLDVEDFIEKATNRNEWYIYNTLTSGLSQKENRIDDLVKMYSKSYRERKLKEHKGDHRNKNFIKEIAEFKINVSDKITRLLLAYIQDVVKVPSKKRVWRDYNIFTEISLFIAEDLGKAFDVEIEELDIRTCNPRIIYSYCGLTLPEGFYGENKKNKKAINILLNSLSKSYAESKGLNLNDRKKRIIRDFKRFNFDEKVIDFLRTFWNRPKDSLFNWCAFHEEKIINKLKAELIESFGKEMYSFTRRHDSILLIGKNIIEEHKETVTLILDNFTYFDKSGWFLPTKEVKEKYVLVSEEMIEEIRRELIF